jgi:hypothetical protein
MDNKVLFFKPQIVNESNTFIGYTASLSKSNLAVKLGISESLISNYSQIGSDISFNISTNYILSGSFNGDTNITYLQDFGEKITRMNDLYFNNAVNFKNFNANSCQHISASVFKDSGLEVFNLNAVNFIGTNNFINSKIVNANFPAYSGKIPSSTFEGCLLLQSVTALSFIGGLESKAFKNCAKDVSIDLSKITSIGISAFENCGKKIVNIPLCTNISDLAFYLSKIQSLVANACTSVGSQGFHSANSLNYVEMNSLQTLAPSGFRNTKVVNFVFPALTSVSHNGFYDSLFVQLIDIKKCKSLLTNVFFNIKTGCLIKINIFLATSNSGSVDANLAYAKDTRSSVVEFYDDNGIYVSNL